MGIGFSFSQLQCEPHHLIRFISAELATIATPVSVASLRQKDQEEEEEEKVNIDDYIDDAYYGPPDDFEDKQLLLRGRFTQRSLESVLRKYARQYVICHSCHTADTQILKNSRKGGSIR